MPAVALNRLRAQIHELAALFVEPERFLGALREFFDLHANRAYRAGQAVQPQPLLPSYRAAPLVMRQLEFELSKTCQQYPLQAIEIVELLWQEPYLEPRLLAAILLGAVPVEHGPSVIETLKRCAQPAQNLQILQALFTNGTVGIRQHKPDLLIDLIGEWIAGPAIEVKVMGVRALIPVIEDEAFQNLPPVFRILSPVVQSFPPALNVDLQRVLQALIRRAPIETFYFMQQVLTLSSSPATARLFRRCLPMFEPAQQANLRAVLASHAKS